MKILAMIMLVLLILAVGFVGYVYKKNAMFLPALFGIGGFPNIKKKDYEEFNIAAFAEEYIEIPTVMYAPKYRR